MQLFLLGSSFRDDKLTLTADLTNPTILYDSHPLLATPDGSAPTNRATQTSIVKLLRGDLRRLSLKDDLLGGRYGNCPGVSSPPGPPARGRSAEARSPAGALDLDMVGELEVAFEIPLGNTLVDQVALLLTAALLVAADR